MDSNKENSINKKNTDGIIDIVNKELEKRKVIKEQTKIIKDKIDNNKQEYIQIIEDEYQYRSKKIDENIFLAIDLTDLRDIFNKESAITYSLGEFEKESQIEEIVKVLTEETYSTVGDMVKNKALVLYEMPKNLKENELMFINDVNMKLCEILEDSYDILFSFNSKDINDDKLKICLITR